MTKENPYVLTEEDKKRLNQVKEKSARKGEREPESLPLITETTCNNIKHILNMVEPESILREQTFDKAITMAEDYFNNFLKDDEATGTKSMFIGIESRLDNEFNSTSARDAALVGITLILKAFEEQFGVEIIENLRKVEDKEVERAIPGHEELRSTVGLSITQRAKVNNLAIPEYQVSLGHFINDFIIYNTRVRGQVEYGAILGYSIMERLWPKLRPQENPRNL